MPLAAAPTWSDYSEMGWYPDMSCYGGYEQSSDGVSVTFVASPGFSITIGEVRCPDWDGYHDYRSGHPGYRYSGYGPWYYHGQGRQSPFRGEGQRGDTRQEEHRADQSDNHRDRPDRGSDNSTRQSGDGFATDRPGFFRDPRADNHSHPDIVARTVGNVLSFALNIFLSAIDRHTQSDDCPRPDRHDDKKKEPVDRSPQAPQPPKSPPQMRLP